MTISTHSNFLHFGTSILKPGIYMPPRTICLIGILIFISSPLFADNFKYIICGDPQFPWACCNVNNRCDEDEDCMIDRLIKCDNELCKDDDSPNDWDDQARKMNRGYVKGMNKLKNNDSRIKGVIINGDLTANATEDQKQDFKQFYEDKLELRIWIGLGNHDLVTNVDKEGRARMIEYFMNRVIKSKKNDDEISNFDFHKEETNGGKKIKGSLSYSYDRGQFHFIQLNFHPNFERKFEQDGITYDIRQSYNWLAEDCDKATRRNKRIIINMHDWEENWGQGERTQFRDAIRETNVEAIFAGHFHPLVGKETEIANTYSTRKHLSGENGTYQIPVFYSGSPMYGKFLLVNFPEDAPIEVTTASVSHNQDSTNIDSVELDPDPYIGVEPVVPYHCHYSSLDAAAGMPIWGACRQYPSCQCATTGDCCNYMPEREAALLISGTQVMIPEGYPVGTPRSCNLELSLFRIDRTFWENGVDAALGPAKQDDPNFENNCETVIQASAGGTGFLKGDSVIFDPSETAQLISTRWPQLPTEFHSDIDAAFRNEDGLTYFFKDHEFVIHADLPNPELTQEPTFIGDFFDVPSFFHLDLDAAFYTKNSLAILIKEGHMVEVNLDGSLGDTPPHAPGTLLSRYHVDTEDFFSIDDQTIGTGDSCEIPLTAETFKLIPFDTGKIADAPYTANWGNIECMENFGNDFWVEWTAPEASDPEDIDYPVNLIVSARGGNSTPMKLGVYHRQDLRRSHCGESPVNLFAGASCMEFNSGGFSTHTFRAVENNTYYIRIGSLDAENRFGFLNIIQGQDPDRPPPPPLPFDTCESAGDLQGNGPFFVGRIVNFAPKASTIKNVTEPEDSNSIDCRDEFGADMWFRWLPDSSGIAKLSLCSVDGGGNLDKVAVFNSEPCVGAVEPIACDRGAPCTQEVSFRVEQAQPYWIRLGVEGNGSIVEGAIQFEMEEDDANEPNQTCQQATLLTLGEHPQVFIDEDLFRVVVPAGGSVQFSVPESEFQPHLELYSECLTKVIADSWSPTNDNGVPEVSFTNTGPHDRSIYARVFGAEDSAEPYDYIASVIIEGDPADDQFEFNNVCESAFDLPVGLHENLISREGDPDWYHVRVPRDGFVWVSLDYDTELALLLQELYGVREGEDFDCTGEPILSFIPPGFFYRNTTDQNEAGYRDFYYELDPFRFRNVTEFNYNLRLRLGDRFDNNVELEGNNNNHCTRAVPLISEGYQDLIVTTEFEDWFAFDVPAGAFLFIEYESVEGGESSAPQLKLFEGLCHQAEEVASSPAFREEQIIRFQQDNTGGIVNLQVKLNSPENTEEIVYYSLRVTIASDCNGDGFPDPNSPAEDCIGRGEDYFEVNNDCDEAISLTASRFENLTVQAENPDWYHVPVPEGNFLEVACEFDSSRTDLQIQLYGIPLGSDRCQRELISSFSEFENGKSIRLDPSVDGYIDYLFSIESPERSTEYALEIIKTDRYPNNSSCETAGSIPSVVLSNGGEEFVTPAGQSEWLEITVEDGQIIYLNADDQASLRLFSSCGGNQIDSAINGDTIAYVHSGPTTTVKIQIEMPPEVLTPEHNLEISVGEILPLQLVEHSPPAHSTSVSPISSVGASFNRDLDPNRVSTDGFQLRGNLSGSYLGTFTHDNTNEFTFQSSQAYKPGEILTFTATTQYTGNELEVLSPPYTWQFRAKTGPSSGVISAHPTHMRLGGQRSVDVALADLDNDGDLDAVVVNTSFNELGQYHTVWLNDGQGILTINPKRSAIPLGISSGSSLDVGDLNGDGFLDLLIASRTSVFATAVFGSGQGTFVQNPEQLSFGSRAGLASESRDLELGDLDGDGDLDAVFVNDHDSPEVGVTGLSNVVYLNDGNGVFTAHPTVPSFGQSHSNEVELGDVDLDGDLDVVVANRLNEPQTVWLNDGTGSLSPHPDAPTFGEGNSEALDLGDIDGDGDLDALVGNVSSQGMTCWVNDGQGVFTPHPVTPEFGARALFNATDLALGDIDGDGDLDALVANNGKPQTTWLNDGTGSFSAHPTKPQFGFQNTFGIALGDLDGDQSLDVITANGSEQPAFVFLNESLAVSFRRGDCSDDGTLDVTDPINNLQFQFLGSFTPPCLDACDFDDSGTVDVTDPIGNLTHQFIGGPPPAPPGKETCGPDPTTDDEVDCESYSTCDAG